MEKGFGWSYVPVNKVGVFLKAGIKRNHKHRYRTFSNFYNANNYTSKREK